MCCINCFWICVSYEMIRFTNTSLQPPNVFLFWPFILYTWVQFATYDTCLLKKLSSGKKNLYNCTCSETWINRLEVVTIIQPMCARLHGTTVHLGVIHVFKKISQDRVTRHDFHALTQHQQSSRCYTVWTLSLLSIFDLDHSGHDQHYAFLWEHNRDDRLRSTGSTLLTTLPLWWMQEWKEHGVFGFHLLTAVLLLLLI